MKTIKKWQKLLIILLLCATPLTVEALSVYIPRPQEDEVQLSKFEFIQLHLAALAYKNEDKALSRFLYGHEIKIQQNKDIQQKNPVVSETTILVELEQVSQPLTQAYFWLGNLHFKKMYSSSGFFWLREDFYRAQYLLNELGYKAGKPDGSKNTTFLIAYSRFCKEMQLNDSDFAAVLEKLEQEADKNVTKLPLVVLRTIPRRTGPWEAPESHPIMKKDYAAALYLAALGYPVPLQSMNVTIEKGHTHIDEIRTIGLQAVLKHFQSEHPQVKQTDGLLDDQVLAELANLFRQKCHREKI